MTTWDKDKMRVWMRKTRIERRKNGVCVICGSYPAINGKARCKACTAYSKAYKKEHKSVKPNRKDKP